MWKGHGWEFSSRNIDLKGNWNKMNGKEWGEFRKRKLTAKFISSRVDLKDWISAVGTSEMNPTVSINNTFWLDGSKPECRVTSNVANNLSSGSNWLSFVKDFIRVVLPINKKPLIL